jgi:hypothetical protein
VVLAGQRAQRQRLSRISSRGRAGHGHRDCAVPGVLKGTVAATGRWPEYGLDDSFCKQHVGREDQVPKLGAVTVGGGQTAWLLQDSHGNSLYVAARGKPYLVRKVAAPPGEGSVNLTQWNAVRIPGPPPASQVVTLSQLEG